MFAPYASLASYRETVMSDEKPEGYGTNWRKWLLIYAIAGVVAYLLIYFLFFSDGGYF
jgi:hypothetical protein